MLSFSVWHMLPSAHYSSTQNYLIIMSSSILGAWYFPLLRSARKVSTTCYFISSKRCQVLKGLCHERHRCFSCLTLNWKHHSVPFYPAYTKKKCPCRVMKKISNKFHQWAPTIITFWWFLQALLQNNFFKFQTNFCHRQQ